MWEAIGRAFCFASLAMLYSAVASAAESGDKSCGGEKPANARAEADCARVEERLRVDPGARRDISPWGASGAFAPRPGDGAMPARLRLDGGYGLNAPRLR